MRWRSVCTGREVLNACDADACTGRLEGASSTAGSTSAFMATSEATDNREDPVEAVQTGVPARMASTAIKAGPASKTVDRDVQILVVI